MDDDALENLVRAVSRAAAAAGDGHPEILTLLRYHQGELPEAEHDGLQEHLVACSLCRGALLDVAAFPALDAPREADALSEDEERADWRRLEEQLGAQPHRPRAPSWPERLHAALRPAWGTPLGAAGLATVSVVALSVWLAQRPVGNVQIADVGRVQSRQRDAGAVARSRVLLQHDSRRLVLLFHLGEDAEVFDQRPSSAPTPASPVVYRLELRRRDDPSPSAVVRADDLTPDDAGNLSLSLRPTALAPGIYEGWLARAGAPPQPAYEFEVVSARR